jgi:hypothetical protein
MSPPQQVPGAHMPDPKGKLSQTEWDRAIAYVREQVSGQVVCVICKTNSWDVSDQVVVAPPWNGQILLNTPAITPFIMVACKKCGHTMFVNAVSAGLFPKSPV